MAERRCTGCGEPFWSTAHAVCEECWGAVAARLNQYTASSGCGPLADGGWCHKKMTFCRDLRACGQACSTHADVAASAA